MRWRRDIGQSAQRLFERSTCADPLGRRIRPRAPGGIVRGIRAQRGLDIAADRVERSLLAAL